MTSHRHSLTLLTLASFIALAGHIEAETTRFLRDGLSFEVPTAFRIQQGPLPRSVSIDPQKGGSGTIKVIWGKVEGRCVIASLHQDFTAEHKPNLIDWGYTTGPTEQISAAPSMTSAYRTYYGKGLAYLTTLCRDGFAVFMISAANPMNPDIFSARSKILQTMNFGGPPTIVGSWWTSGWNLTFDAGQVISHGWGDVACRGTYEVAGQTLRTSSWSCRPAPPLNGSCSMSLTNAELILNCAHGGWTFKRSEL